MSSPGELILRSDVLEAVLLPEVGGRLHRLRAFGRDLLRTPDDPGVHGQEPFFWGAYPMAPWCNRARPGRHVVAGREIDLVANFEDGSAIHGLVASVPWAVTGPGHLRVAGGGDERWPWPFEVSLEAAVDGAALRLAYRLTNRSAAPMPAGLGLHPWFRRPVELRVPADAVYPQNSDSASDPGPATGDLDLGRLAPPPNGLDGTWTSLRAPWIALSWPELGVRANVRIGLHGAGPLVAVATPAHLDAIAVEPQTHGPDPLRRLERAEPDAPALLAPGDVLALDLDLAVELARDVR